MTITDLIEQLRRLPSDTQVMVRVQDIKKMPAYATVGGLEWWPSSKSVVINPEQKETKK